MAFDRTENSPINKIDVELQKSTILDKKGSHLQKSILLFSLNILSLAMTRLRQLLPLLCQNILRHHRDGGDLKRPFRH
jgi:hypothetical protein